MSKLLYKYIDSLCKNKTDTYLKAKYGLKIIV